MPASEASGFHVASEQEIKAGKVTDVYFARTVEVLRREGVRKHVLAEVRASSLPRDYQWAVLAGVEELAAPIAELAVKVTCLEEGEFFLERRGRSPDRPGNGGPGQSPAPTCCWPWRPRVQVLRERVLAQLRSGHWSLGRE